MWFALAVLAVLFLAYHIKKFRHPKDFPPGPRFPLPLVGDGYVMGSDITKGFYDLRKKYGDMVGLFLGKQRSVALFDADTIIEALAMDEISGRGNFGDDIMEKVQGAPGRYVYQLITYLLLFS